MSTVCSISLYHVKFDIFSWQNHPASEGLIEFQNELSNLQKEKEDLLVRVRELETSSTATDLQVFLSYYISF